MNETDARKTFGEFSCSVYDYLTHSPQIMQEHIAKVHPDLKRALKQKAIDNQYWDALQ